MGVALGAVADHRHLAAADQIGVGVLLVKDVGHSYLPPSPPFGRSTIVAGGRSAAPKAPSPAASRKGTAEGERLCREPEARLARRASSACECEIVRLPSRCAGVAPAAPT